MNKQQLAAKIWESANKMRSKIEANEYKDYILGFIFYKFLSEKEVKYLKENDWTDEYLPELTEEDTETVESVQKNLGYFIAYDNLFSTWLEKGRDFSVQDVRDALSAFSRLINATHKKVFEGVFDTLQTGLSKLGDSSASQSKAISDLIHLIKDIPMDGKQDYDVLGFIYEYLISMFAANAGKKAGEFYTPHEVSLLMSEIVADHLKDRTEIKIYDPTSGSGSLLINIGKSVAKFIENENNIKYYAQELKQNTYNLTRMNLVMRGILPDNIVTRNGDTLEDDWPYFDENDPIGTYDPLYVDAVVSNPPYSQAWNPVDKEIDPRYARFGLAPKGKADYAFLLHDLFHIKSDGIMTIVLPHGVLFRGGEEGEIRKNLIEQNHIDAIIGLPANIFFGTGIPTIIMVLKQKRTNTDILIVDASKGFIKVGKNNKLRASDIKKIVDVVTKRESVDKFSRVVSRDEVRQNDYNLNIPRYVDSSEAAESWDIYASMFGGIPVSEIDELREYWRAFPSLREGLFEKTSEKYCRLTAADVKKAIMEHSDVKAFAYNPARINVGSIGYQNTSKSVIVSSLYEVFKTTEDVDDRFLWHWFKSDDFQKLIIQLQEGGVRLYFYYDKLCMGTISLPTLEEQHRIGELLDKLDNLITLHQRKYDKLTKVKKSMLEKMFPKNGATVPEIRFQGFSDAWEQRKLGEVGKARSGVGFPDSAQGGTVGIPFFKVSDMNLAGNENEMIVANNYVSEAQIASHRWTPIEELPAIFFAKVGAAVMLNRKRLCRFPFLLDNNTMAYSLDKKSWNADFAKALFETIDLTSLVQVGALPSYNAGDVEALKISLPEIEEQEQIGSFFQSLDDLITLHQRELEKLKNLKKACLEKMFV